MKVLFSVGRVSVAVTILSFLTFGQVQAQAQAQMQAQQPKAPPQAQQEPITPPVIANEKEPTDTSPVSSELFEEKHKDESILFLHYDISVELHEDWSYTTRTHKKIKILKEEAKAMGEVPVYYEKGREKIVDLKAYTTTPDGKRHRYSKIQDLRVYEGFLMYSDSRMKVITLPEVNIGSILEYESTVASKGKPIKDAFWTYYEFNTSIPMKESNFSVTFPKKLNIQYKEFNLEYKPTITETNSAITYSWHLQNLDKYEEPESFLPPPDLNSVKNIVEFSSIKSWADISDWYYCLVLKNLKINPAIEKAAEKAIKGKITIKDKARAILEYIQENFRYVSMSFGGNTLEPHPTDEVFRNKYGDCKDLSLLCMAMLKIAGIKSHIALFNDEFSITDPQYDPPFPTLFDHVLLLVEDPKEGDFYIDPLLDGYDIGQYPAYYQRAYTFIITEDGGKFGRFPVFDESRDCSRTEQTVAIGTDGSGLVEVDALWELDFSIEMRDKFKALNDKEKEKLFQKLDATYGEVLERKWKGLEEKYGPMSSYLKYKQEDMYPITDDMIIIDLSDNSRFTDFTEKERKNPIFFPVNFLKESITTYRIPEGFRISHIPKNLDLDIGFFSLKRQYEQKKNAITLTHITKSKRTEIPVKDYEKIQDFHKQLPKELNQRIVLKKIKPWWQEIKDIFARFKKSRQ